MEYLNIIIAAILVNNLLLTQVLGIDSAVIVTKSKRTTMVFSIFTLLITVIATILSKLLNDYVLVENSLEYLRMISFVLIDAVVITIAYEILKNKVKKECNAFIYNLTINSLILGGGLLVVENNLTIIQTLLYSIGISLGFMLILVIVSSINDKYKYSNMPEKFKGTVTTLLALGLVSLAFYGFKGLI